MKLTGENRRTRGKTCISVTLSTTNPTWTYPESNPGLRGGRLAANHLSRGTASRYVYILHYNVLKITNDVFIAQVLIPHPRNFKQFLHIQLRQRESNYVRHHRRSCGKILLVQTIVGPFISSINKMIEVIVQF
jgi:hypothetical protein